MDKMDFKQETLPGFEDYVCTYQCLNHCPFKECIYDDPLFGNEGYDDDPIFEAEFHTEEFEYWRFSHKELVKHESKDKHKIRCPRCFSNDIIVLQQCLFCKNCYYNEPLVDYTVSRRIN